MVVFSDCGVHKALMEHGANVQKVCVPADFDLFMDALYAEMAISIKLLLVNVISVHTVSFICRLYNCLSITSMPSMTCACTVAELGGWAQTKCLYNCSIS